jgi:spermidine synthase
LAVDAVLHQSRTRFQEVFVFKNAVFGTVLVLDGVIQLTERDNHIYHEMIAHVPLVAHGSARNVLVVGGDDGGTLKEVLKHPVASVVLVELDGEVIDLSRHYLPGVSGGAFDDPRVMVIVDDGAQYVAESDAEFDVVIIDSTDPVGPGEALFSAAFYRDCQKRLRAGGLITVQSGTPFFQPSELEAACSRLSRCFGTARPFLSPVPTYAGGALALVAAGQTQEHFYPSAEILQQRFHGLVGRTRYYSPEVHRAAFVLPPSFEPRFEERG